MDPHVDARDMLVEIPRRDDDEPVLTAGNPVKLSKVATGPETMLPGPGDHTDEVLADVLGLSDAEIADLRANEVV